MFLDFVGASLSRNMLANKATSTAVDEVILAGEVLKS